MWWWWKWSLRHASHPACPTSGTLTSLPRTGWAGSRWFHHLRPFRLDLLPPCLILVTLLPSGHLATLCGRQSWIPLLCAIQVSLLIWKESGWYYLQSKIIIKPSKKATTELRDVPNSPFLTNGRRLDHYHNKGSGKCLSQSKRVSSRKITNNVDADSDIEIIYN